MTNQPQPLTLKLSNGQEVTVPSGKSVLQYTNHGLQRSCAIVRGPEGVAVYNTEGDIQINGAPSAAHWLQPGDELRFGDSMTASVQQLGVVSEALESLLNETAAPTAPAVAPVANAPVANAPVANAPVANAPTSFTPATQATAFAPATAPVAPAAPVAPVAPVAQNTFISATQATTFSPEPQAAAPIVAAPPATPEVAIPDMSSMGLTAPAVTAAALAASAMSVTGAFQGEPATPTNLQPAPAQSPAPFTSAPETAATVETPAAQPEISGFAADLLARIQADENVTVGTTTHETTHSPVATDGLSFSPPAPETTPETPLNTSQSISSLIPELPQASALAPAPQADPVIEPAPAPAPAATNHVETTTAESSERQSQSSSASALLERMKSEGQWDATAEQNEEVAPEEKVAPEAPAFAEADDDVQSYMSQLLSRMRDPNAEPQPVAAAAPKPEQKQVAQEAVERPKPVGLLKPEEFVPKNKAKRLDSLQDMRALANTQTRTAIVRSQAKRKAAVSDNLNLVIAIGSCILAALVFFFQVFGNMSLVFGMIAMIVGAFFCCKTYFAEQVASSKNKNEQSDAAQKAV